MKKIFAGLIAMMILLVGCSSGGSGLKEIKTSDLCVTHINLDAKLCYGDERKEVERITGKAEMERSNFVSYANNLNVIYREDKVVLLGLSEGSDVAYQASMQVQFRETRKELKERFGDKYNSNLPETELNYLYDVKNNQLITNDSEIKVSVIDESENFLSLSISFDETGEVKRIYLSDWGALKYGG